MSYSLAKSVNYICKLHTAALEAAPNSGVLSIYPMLDGMYVSSPSQQPLLDFLAAVFHRAAENFVAEEEHYHRFLIKAAVAYGQLAHGKNIPAAAGAIFEKHTGHRDSLLFGMPIIQAFQSEKFAPPFGIYIHESARSFSPKDEKPFPYIWWRWFKPTESELVGAMKKTLTEYFTFCQKHSRSMNYSPERIEEHYNSAKEYFDEY